MDSQISTRYLKQIFPWYHFLENEVSKYALAFGISCVVENIFRSCSIEFYKTFMENIFPKWKLQWNLNWLSIRCFVNTKFYLSVFYLSIQFYFDPRLVEKFWILFLFIIDKSCETLNVLQFVYRISSAAVSL